MRKKLLAVFVSVMMAFSVGALMTVNAGITENKPAGDGLLNAAGELNNTSFKILETKEGDANAYSSSRGNMALHFNGDTASEGDEFIPAASISKDLLAKENVSYRFQFDLYSFAADWSGHTNQLVFNPAAKSIGDSTGALLFNGRGQVINNIGNNTREGSDPRLLWKENGKGDGVDLSAAGAATSVGAMIWREPDIKPVITENGYATFYIEMTLKSDGWMDGKIGVGLSDKNGNITSTVKYGILENWVKYDSTKDVYFFSMFKYGTDMIVDDLRISVSYTENSEAKTETVAHYDMENSEKIVSAWHDGIGSDELIVSRGYEFASLSEVGLLITNPAEGSGVVTRAELSTDKSLATNLELDTKFALRVLAEGQKVGLGFGYESSRQLTGAHKFLYFTVTGGKVMFGGESVDEEGNATELFTPVEVTDATVGSEAAAIGLKLTGKGVNLEIQVGAVEPFAVENFDPNGFFAVTHKGAGNLTYMILDNLTMNGYEFIENEEGAAAISSNFTGNYINGNKFQSHSSISPENHIVKGDQTTHDITGMVAENGKLGFYGTSTGTRLLTTKKYADFVMQFDYISLPSLQRGQIVSVTRPSAAYMMFGMKEGGLALSDASVYSLGIYEGIADPNMYGDNESVVTSLGMAYSCGAVTVATSKLVKTDSPSETSIPRYNAGGYNASKPNNNVMEWYNPKPEGSTYSFYNKTTRVKLVVVNNQVALYAAEVDSETGAVGTYIELMKFTAKDTEGYVGIGSDSPGWFEIDNFAVTPVSREKAIELGADVELSATGIVDDIAPSDMANDPMPSPLAKPQLTADTANKKVKWNAVDGAADYEVTVKLGAETVLEQTVTATEIDLSSLTAEGTYKVTVKANPTDADNYLASRENIDYVVRGGSGGDTTDPGDDEKDDGKGGCGCGKSSAAAAGAIASCVAIAAVVMIKRR